MKNHCEIDRYLGWGATENEIKESNNHMIGFKEVTLISSKIAKGTIVKHIL